MLTSIELWDFKSFREASLPLAPLTLLIGANASGKSNALEGVRLLNWLAQGQKLINIRYKVQDSDAILRGRIEQIGYLDSNVFSVGCETTSYWNTMWITLEARDDELHIIDEIIQTENEYFLYRLEHPASPPGNDISVAYNNFARGGKKPRIVCTDQMAVFTQLDSPATFAKNHKKSKKEIPKTTKAYQEYLGGMLFLDPVPSLMRESEFKSEKRLRSDGRNLSGVLFNLCQEKKNKKIILDLIRSLPEQNINNIEFQETARDKVLVEVEENFGPSIRSWDSTILSDGTLRVLAIAAALLSAPEGSLVVIEEVDNGVHPSRASHLLKTMRDLATSRNLRLLLSTHNPALMDAIPDEALGDVVFCYRDPDEGDSRLIRLSDLPDYPALAARGPLGQLVTTQVVERFAKDKTTPAEKKKEALAWIDSLASGGGK